jgi:hypothetical protein
MSTALLGEAIDPKSIQQQHNTNKKIPSHSGAPPLEFIRTSSRIFTGNNKRAGGNILIPDLFLECGCIIKSAQLIRSIHPFPSSI